MQKLIFKSITNRFGSAKNVLFLFSVLFVSFTLFHHNLGYPAKDFNRNDGQHISVLTTVASENTQIRKSFPDIAFQLFVLNNEKIEQPVVEPEVKDDDNLKSLFLFNPVYTTINKASSASVHSAVIKSQQFRTSVQLYILFHAWKGFIA